MQTSQIFDGLVSGAKTSGTPLTPATDAAGGSSDFKDVLNSLAAETNGTPDGGQPPPSGNDTALLVSKSRSATAIDGLVPVLDQTANAGGTSVAGGAKTSAEDAMIAAQTATETARSGDALTSEASKTATAAGTNPAGHSELPMTSRLPFDNASIAYGSTKELSDESRPNVPSSATIRGGGEDSPIVDDTITDRSPARDGSTPTVDSARESNRDFPTPDRHRTSDVFPVSLVRNPSDKAWTNDEFPISLVRNPTDKAWTNDEFPISLVRNPTDGMTSEIKHDRALPVSLGTDGFAAGSQRQESVLSASVLSATATPDEKQAILKQLQLDANAKTFDGAGLPLSDKLSSTQTSPVQVTTPNTKIDVLGSKAIATGSDLAMKEGTVTPAPVFRTAVGDSAQAPNTPPLVSVSAAGYAPSPPARESRNTSAPPAVAGPPVVIGPPVVAAPPVTPVPPPATPGVIREDRGNPAFTEEFLRPLGDPGHSSIQSDHRAAAVAGSRAPTEFVPPRQIAMQLAEATRPMPDGPVEVTLDPEELGRVRMTLTAGDGIMMVSLNVDRVETADLLRRNLDTLSQEFRNMGYTDVAFSFEGGNSDETFGSGTRGANEPSLLPEESHEVAAEASPLRPSGGMDLRL